MTKNIYKVLFLLFLYAISLTPLASASKLITSEYSCDLGTAVKSMRLETSFVVSNPSERPLVIRLVRTSCECLQVASNPSEIAPGKDGIFHIVLIPDKPGEVIYRVFIEAEKESKELLVYVLKADVKESSDQLKGLEIPAELRARKTKKRSPELLINLRALQEMLTSGKTVVLADIRKADDYSEFRIPKSTNVSLYSIKNRSAWKGKTSVVIVDKGCCISKAEKECRRLREMGFSVFILDGGLKAWREAGFAFEGQLESASALDAVTPEELFEEKDFDDWIIIDADALQAESGSFFQDAAHIPFDENSTADQSAKTDLRNLLKDKEKSRVLIFTEDGTGYGKIKDKDITGLYFLKGGLSAYRAHIEQLILGDHVSLNEPKRDPKSGSIITKKPCGSCPK